MRICKLALGLWMIVLPEGWLLSQVNTANITGTVSDPSGSAIPNARIEAGNEQTGVRITANSSTDGRFTLADLPIGTYDFTVSATGFELFKQAGIAVTAGQTVDLKFALAVGSMQQTVEVSSQATALSYESIDQHSVVDERGVSNLPLAKLDWTACW